jgi:hypothetical protein
VALSADGNTALIGAPGGCGPNCPSGGGAAVLTRSGSTWTKQEELGSGLHETSCDPGFEGLTDFGTSVALSADGNTALVGGPRRCYENCPQGGTASVFTRSGSTWTRQGEKLTGGGEIGEGLFGSSVALSSDGNTALIGGPADESRAGCCGPEGRGAAWVFIRSGATWTQQGEKLNGGGEIGEGLFGSSVALSAGGDTALIGGPGDNHEAGAAWMFTRSGSTWTQQGEKLTASGESGKGLFGKSVALSSDGITALIGGPRDEAVQGGGAVWVFVNGRPHR